MEYELQLATFLLLPIKLVKNAPECVGAKRVKFSPTIAETADTTTIEGGAGGCFTKEVTAAHYINQ